jgi:hypothetical protein
VDYAEELENEELKQLVENLRGRGFTVTPPDKGESSKDA